MYQPCFLALKDDLMAYKQLLESIGSETAAVAVYERALRVSTAVSKRRSSDVRFLLKNYEPSETCACRWTRFSRFFCRSLPAPQIFIFVLQGAERFDCVAVQGALPALQQLSGVVVDQQADGQLEGCHGGQWDCVLVVTYLIHVFQSSAVAKLLGGHSCVKGPLKQGWQRPRLVAVCCDALHPGTAGHLDSEGH